MIRKEWIREERLEKEEEILGRERLGRVKIRKKRKD